MSFNRRMKQLSAISGYMMPNPGLIQTSSGMVPASAALIPTSNGLMVSSALMAPGPNASVIVPPDGSAGYPENTSFNQVSCKCEHSCC